MSGDAQHACPADHEQEPAKVISASVLMMTHGRMLILLSLRTGASACSNCRGRAEQVAEAVGAPEDEVKALSQMIGAALGTQQVITSSRARNSPGLPGPPHLLLSSPLPGYLPAPSR